MRQPFLGWQENTIPTLPALGAAAAGATRFPVEEPSTRTEPCHFHDRLNIAYLSVSFRSFQCSLPNKIAIHVIMVTCFMKKFYYFLFDHFDVHLIYLI